MPDDPELEDRLLWLVKAMVVAGGLVLATGLLFHVLSSGTRITAVMLQAGLILLMATPALRILIAVADRIRRRDLQFVVVTLIVVFELTVTMWYATTRV